MSDYFKGCNLLCRFMISLLILTLTISTFASFVMTKHFITPLGLASIFSILIVRFVVSPICLLFTKNSEDWIITSSLLFCDFEIVNFTISILLLFDKLSYMLMEKSFGLAFLNYYDLSLADILYSYDGITKFTIWFSIAICILAFISMPLSFHISNWNRQLDCLKLANLILTFFFLCYVFVALYFKWKLKIDSIFSLELKNIYLICSICAIFPLVCFVLTILYDDFLTFYKLNLKYSLRNFYSRRQAVDYVNNQSLKKYVDTSENFVFNEEIKGFTKVYIDNYEYNTTPIRVVEEWDIQPDEFDDIGRYIQIKNIKAQIEEEEKEKLEDKNEEQKQIEQKEIEDAFTEYDTEEDND